jgi:hypothetical protein
MSRRISGSAGPSTRCSTDCRQAGPRLLFKGGTSLSKAFGLISRFSEDIDVTVFRDDLGEGGNVEALEELSGKKRKAKLDAIKAACQAFIVGTLQTQLEALFGKTINQAKVPAAGQGIVLDPDDADRQSLLIWYPSVTAPAGVYIRPAIKIESGAKSALDPHRVTIVRPYVSELASPGFARNLGVRRRDGRPAFCWCPVVR